MAVINSVIGTLNGELIENGLRTEISEPGLLGSRTDRAHVMAVEAAAAAAAAKP